MTQRYFVGGVVVGLLAVIGAVGLAAQEAPKAPAPSIAGKWTLTLVTENFTATTALELKQEGEKITGTYTGRYGSFPLEGTLKGRALQFAFTMNADGTPTAMSFVGEVAPDNQTMKGKATLGEMGEATWTAARPKEHQ
ncbi:MAG TPA: hypothetical protein VES67_09075 [Vicinamibacterales bacterium]|nr:hypothetical protein [Vicinamibacterales bacterium]